MRPTSAPAPIPCQTVVPLEPYDSLEPQEQKNDEEWLRRRLDCHSPELEQPGREPGEHDDDRRHKPAALRPAREHPSSSTAARTRSAESPRATYWSGPGELEDGGQQVRIRRTLVVVERPEEEREACAILIA